MAKVSDNKFPKVILEERLSDGSDTSNPAADHRALFLGEDGLLHLRDSSGTITDVGGSGSVATDAIWDAKGDLAGGTGANTAARLAVGTNGHVLTADSGETTGMKWAAAAGGGSHVAGRATRTAGDVTTTSTSFVDLTGASITLTTGATRVFLSFSCSVTCSDSAHMGFDFDIDGTRAMSASASGIARARIINAGDDIPLTISYLTDVLTAASHTFKVQWRVGAGTGTLRASTTAAGYSFSAVETGATA